jgi:hypothetical protein
MLEQPWDRVQRSSDFTPRRTLSLQRATDASGLFTCAPARRRLERVLCSLPEPRGLHRAPFALRVNFYRDNPRNSRHPVTEPSSCFTKADSARRTTATPRPRICFPGADHTAPSPWVGSLKGPYRSPLIARIWLHESHRYSRAHGSGQSYPLNSKRSWGTNDARCRGWAAAPLFSGVVPKR